MKNIDEHIDLIERYLYDDLTQDELEEFNDLLRKDAEFNKLFYEMDHLLDGIRRSAKQTTIEEKLARLEEALPMEDAESANEEGTPVIPIWSAVTRYGAAFTGGEAFSAIYNRKYRMAIAAGFTLLIIATFTLFNILKNPTPEKLFAQYYKPFENQGSDMKRGNDIEKGQVDKEMLREALIEYDQGKFSQAASIFDDITINDENKYQVWLYGGNAYLNDGQVEKAKNMFMNVIEENAGYVVYAKWYLSLCYIKNDEYVNAKPLLEEIREMGKYKSKEASEILSKI